MPVATTVVVDVAVSVNGVASLTKAQAPSAPPVKVALVIVAVPSALTVPLKVALQVSFGKFGAVRLVVPVAVTDAPLGENDDARAGLAAAMQATAKIAARCFIFILSLMCGVTFRQGYFPYSLDVAADQAGGSDQKKIIKFRRVTFPQPTNSLMRQGAVARVGMIRSAWPR